MSLQKSILKDPIFYGKILLFGEYGIIEDSMGLSIPYNYYNGSFRFPEQAEESDQSSNRHLRKYLEYLTEAHSNGTLPVALDLIRFSEDIENGLSFHSNIPQGFGVGSSGALVAAIYQRYALNRIDSGEQLTGDQILKLKQQLGFMESYFHGKSSGLDPLICYLNFPILIKSREDLGTVGLPENRAEGKGAIFLLNSGSPGKTQPMVNIFMERMKQEGFRNMLRKEFKKYNDACIQAFLQKDINPLFKNLKELSRLALEHFSPMIPNQFHQLWREGIESNSYYLKLCGSGGGGYFLGFTKDLEHARIKLKDHQIEVIHSF